MRAKNRLSPYPILCEYSDDYKESSFSTKIDSELDGYGRVKIHVEFQLKSEYLQKLIDEGKATFVTHVECPRTSLRKILQDNSFLHEISISLDNVVSTIEVNTFIIALEDFEYGSSEFHSDYSGYHFSVSKGNILAVGNATSISVDNTNNLENFSSIIRIVKIDSAERAMSVDTDNDDFIKIKLSSDVCRLYRTLGNALLVKTCFSLILFPSLCEVIKRMVADSESLEDKKWYKVITNLLDKKKMSIEKLDLSDGSIMDACQKIFDDPITKAMEELAKKVGALYED